jgi:hypothetical protein
MIPAATQYVLELSLPGCRAYVGHEPGEVALDQQGARKFPSPGDALSTWATARAAEYPDCGPALPVRYEEPPATARPALEAWRARRRALFAPPAANANGHAHEANGTAR